MSVHLVLYEPEIPPNTGNAARLCAALGVPLHLIEPLGFTLDDKRLKRAGLDYWPQVEMRVWPDLPAYLNGAGEGRRLVGASTKRGGNSAPVQSAAFSARDSLLLGPETRGLPDAVLERCALQVRIPMRASARSLNMATAAGIVLYAALANLGLLDAL